MKKFILIIIIIGVFVSGCTVGTTDPTSTTTVRNWTVPYDNLNDLAFYEFKYTADSSLAWDSWTDVVGEPVPEAVGNSQSWDMPLPNGVWFVAMKSSDNSGNWSEISNIAHVLIDTIPPEPVNDLR